MFKRNKRAAMGNGSDWPTYAYKGSKLRRHKRERAKKGYSTFDWWSFDTYITWVIGNAALDFKHGFGYIYGDNDKDHEEFIDSIAKPLLEYSEKKFDVFGDEEVELYENAQAAMHKFADYLGHFWD